MNPYPFVTLLDPSIISHRKILCARSRKCRYHYRRCRIASARAARLVPDMPAIFQSLRPSRARILAERAAWRMQQISLRHYHFYTEAAMAFMRGES